jgi:hypothetical protein
MLRPMQTIRVTTKEELDAALARAGQVVVEGNDELLSYAIERHAARARTVPPLAQKIVMAMGALVTLLIFGSIISWYLRFPAALHSLPWLWSVFRPLVVIVAIIALFLIVRQAISNVTIAALLVLLSAAGSWHLLSLGPATISARVPSATVDLPTVDLPTELLWPLAAIVAITALFFLAKEAISNGSNVTLLALPLVLLSAAGAWYSWYLLSDEEKLAPALTASASGPDQPPTDFWANLPSMLWQLVAIVAIFSVTLIAWLAIRQGNNVTFTVRITEKVQARVVLTVPRERL